MPCVQFNCLPVGSCNNKPSSAGKMKKQYHQTFGHTIMLPCTRVLINASCFRRVLRIIGELFKEVWLTNSIGRHRSSRLIRTTLVERITASYPLQMATKRELWTRSNYRVCLAVGGPVDDSTRRSPTPSVRSSPPSRQLNRFSAMKFKVSIEGRGKRGREMGSERGKGAAAVSVLVPTESFVMPR